MAGVRIQNCTNISLHNIFIEGIEEGVIVKQSKKITMSNITIIPDSTKKRSTNTAKHMPNHMPPFKLKGVFIVVRMLFIKQ